MDKIANIEADQRRELFQETGARKGIHSAIVEKDFWVCWVLKHIFEDPGLRSHVIFKGGTSLSKVFGLIERFSEDIDLILDWSLLGYGPGQQDPFPDDMSNTKRDHFNKRFNEVAAAYIRETLCSQLADVLGICPEVRLSVDDREGQVVQIHYPAAFSQTYLRPEVRLEIGPLASWVPHAEYSIRAYAADAFPKLFTDPDCPVIAIKAQRTFWEKATILHQQAHNPRPIPSRYSRHYYDLFRLAESAIRAAALADLQLLADVVAFKQRFYPCNWARYDEAKRGTFRLIPLPAGVDQLKADYEQMRIMIFGERPEFGRIIATLHSLEDEINGRAS
jgi:hypothetical protein